MVRALTVFLVVLSCAIPLWAGVTVEEDEVIFTLTAPGAERVFLVGDFNRWNPTVDRMYKDGDSFEYSLFMVEGVYRYKFVVDGEWIVDPDNPNSDDNGSLLALEETPVGLALREAPRPAAKTLPAIRPTFRVLADESDEEVSDLQDRADLFVGLDRGSLTGRVVVESLEPDWHTESPFVRAQWNRGFIQAKAIGLKVRAFDRDSTWSTTDPFGLFAASGPFLYNPGLERSGVSALGELEAGVRLLASWVNDTRARGGSSAFSEPDTALTSPDQFSRDVSTGGEDTFVMELSFDGRDGSGGVVRRDTRNARRNLIAFADSTLFSAATESAVVTTYWLNLKRLLPVPLQLAYAAGKQQLESDRLTPPNFPIASSVAALPTTDMQRLSRWGVSSNPQAFGWQWYAGWDFRRHRFDGIYKRSLATVQVGEMGAHRVTDEWDIGLRVRFVDPKYNNSPDVYVPFAVTRDVWASGRDAIGVADVVGLQFDAYGHAHATVAWARPDSVRALWVPAIALDAEVVTESGNKLRYVSAHTTLNWVVDRYGFTLDGRYAKHDLPDVSAMQGYAEVSASVGPITANLGWGFDPTRYDPVENLIVDRGRERFLIDQSNVAQRSELAARADALAQRERIIEAVNAVRLEVVLWF